MLKASTDSHPGEQLLPRWSTGCFVESLQRQCLRIVSKGTAFFLFLGEEGVQGCYIVLVGRRERRHDATGTSPTRVNRRGRGTSDPATMER